MAQGIEKVLVTGGAGYIGSHAARALALRGHVPICYDNLVYGHRWAVRSGPLIEGDIADRDHLTEVLRNYGISAIMHFAAFAYVGESVTNPRRYFENNVTKSLVLLDRRRRSAVLRLFIELRHLWNAGDRPDRRGHSTAAGQSLR